MPEFLSFLLTAILIIYIVRSLARILLPMLFQGVINKAQHQNRQPPPAGGPRQNYNRNPAPGKIKVDYMPESKKGTIPDSEGDFVDYEEVK